MHALHLGVCGAVLPPRRLVDERGQALTGAQHALGAAEHKGNGLALFLVAWSRSAW
jgi:hypothetical protein